MEKICLYSVYDLKAQKYDTPWFTASDLFATRKFTLALEQDATVFNRFKNEFVLRKIGDFHVLTGEFTMDIKDVIEGKQIAIGGEKNAFSNET